MSRLLPSYLHSLRKQCGLSQPELASLLGISASALSRIENLSRRPGAQIIVGAEVIFGRHAVEVFPGFYRATENRIVERSLALRQELEQLSAAGTAAKLETLAALIERAGNSLSHL